MRKKAHWIGVVAFLLSSTAFASPSWRECLAPIASKVAGLLGIPRAAGTSPIVWPWEDTSFDHGLVTERYRDMMQGIAAHARKCRAQQLDFHEAHEIGAGLAYAVEGLSPAEIRGLLAVILAPERFGQKRRGFDLLLEDRAFMLPLALSTTSALLELGSEEAFAIFILVGDATMEMAQTQHFPLYHAQRMRPLIRRVMTFLDAEEKRAPKDSILSYQVTYAQSVARILLTDLPPFEPSDR